MIKKVNYKNGPEHFIGQKILLIDLVSGLSPLIKIIVDSGVAGNDVIEELNNGLNNLLCRVAKKHLDVEWNGCDSSGFYLRSETQIKTPEDRKKEYEKLLIKTRKSFVKSDKKRLEAMKNDPNNGTLGYWEVDGIRHSAIVRAKSAPEAVEIADQKGLVDKGWEMPTVHFIGKRMPRAY